MVTVKPGAANSSQTNSDAGLFSRDVDNMIRTLDSNANNQKLCARKSERVMPNQRFLRRSKSGAEIAESHAGARDNANTSHARKRTTMTALRCSGMTIEIMRWSADAAQSLQFVPASGGFQ